MARARTTASEGAAAPAEDAGGGSSGRWRQLPAWLRHPVVRGGAVAVIALVVGIVIAPGGPGGLVLRSYNDGNLWALAPAGWKKEALVTPYGSALASFVDEGKAADSETVRASDPAGPSPRARAVARAHQLGHVAYLLDTVAFGGGRLAWLLQYMLGGSYSAIVEFNACTPAIAMTVTLTASSESALARELDELPEGAEPVCDGPAFSALDRADLAIPLHLPS